MAGGSPSATSVALNTVWTWAQLKLLPSERLTVDIHCVTTWSKLGTEWEGVSLDTLFESVDTAAEFALVGSYGGYTTNFPVTDLLGGKAWIVYGYQGEPLPPVHGGPARLLVPHLYFWKSAKWVRSIELCGSDTPGFWERLGYHNYGDPWRNTSTPGIDSWTMVLTPDPLRWRVGRVVDSTPETETARTIALAVPGWGGHLAGQHIDLKLTAEDGYSAQRSYSLSRPPDGEHIELTVQQIADGECSSPYLLAMGPGEEIEVRGPIGGWFVWQPADEARILFVAADRASCR